nr:hypothetical protein [Rhodococcus sp. ACS1]
MVEIASVEEEWLSLIDRAALDPSDDENVIAGADDVVRSAFDSCETVGQDGSTGAVPCEVSVCVWYTSKVQSDRLLFAAKDIHCKWLARKVCRGLTFGAHGYEHQRWCQ